MEEKQNAALGTAPLGKLMVKFALPCTISLLVGALYNIVDQIFIGWGVGYLGNGATSVVFPLTVLALGLSSERQASSTAAVLNENGVVIDHAILGQGGPVVKADMDSFLDNVCKIYQNNEVDVIILNGALLSQTRLLQKNISERVGAVAVGERRESEA